MAFICFLSVNGQIQKIDANKEYRGILLTKASTLAYTLSLAKGGVYKFSILQQGIAVYNRLPGVRWWICIP
jgi:hypothetical protein